MDTPSLGKNHYFCLLVNNKTCYLWFLPCARKSDFTAWFTCLNALFANHYHSHMNILHTDQGGEYINETLKSYCAENGISIELTIPHTPEQNGVAEHSNRRVLDKGQTLLKDAGAPNFLWADAFATAIYAINCTVNSSLGDITLFEAFFGWKPNISHMRVWYSDVFVHRPKDLGAKKLGERSHHMKFLGYPHNSSGYRTYDPVTHKVEVVRAPIFHEEARPHASIFFELEAVHSNDDLLLDPANAPPQES